MLFIFFFNFLIQELKTVEIKIIQNEDTIFISDLDNIIIDKSQFSFEFILDDYDEDNWYSARFTASLDSTIFNFGVNTLLDNILFFQPGAGLATTDIYQSMYLTSNACHYIIYNNNLDYSQRAEYIGESNDGRNILQWEVNNFSGEVEGSIEEVKLDKLYIVFFIDQNLNNILEEKEFIRFTISFWIILM